MLPFDKIGIAAFYKLLYSYNINHLGENPASFIKIIKFYFWGSKLLCTSMVFHF